MASSDPTPWLTFRLDPAFVAWWRAQPTAFGFDGLGELVYKRTYARLRTDGTHESWVDTCERVINGVYTIQRDHIMGHGLGWDEAQGQRSAQEMFTRMFTMKFLPPGRGLWAMGTEHVHGKKGSGAALNNCAFVSTGNILVERTRPFTFLMDGSLQGAGVGFDTKGANVIRVAPPTAAPEPHTVSDSREGWVESLHLLLDAWFVGGGAPPVFDYSAIRPRGTPLKRFGGRAAGPEPLERLHVRIVQVLRREADARGGVLSCTGIVDVMNLIGCCVAEGSRRRSAEIAFGEYRDAEFLDLKNYEKNPRRAAYGWTSNNSVFVSVGGDYTDVCARIIKNGEPGLCWLETMRKYGRLCDPPSGADHRVAGGNPCLEQSLESYEMCTLVETFPMRCEGRGDFLRTLKFAFLYAKTVTLTRTENPETNRVMLRNRRIGCSISGVAQFLARHRLDELREWLTAGYSTIHGWDRVYSEWLCISRSVKVTSVKPSGTVSLLAGATPGMHYPEARTSIRRIRMANDDPLLGAVGRAGYRIIPVPEEGQIVVVEFPIDGTGGVRGVRTAVEVPMWEQLSLAAFLQRYWADNQVSCTVTFDVKTEGPQLATAIDLFQYQLKGVAFLPRTETPPFPFMPIEAVSEEAFARYRSGLRPIFWDAAPEGCGSWTPPRIIPAVLPQGLKGCDGDTCVL